MDLYLDGTKLGQTNISPESTVGQVKQIFHQWLLTKNIKNYTITIFLNNETTINPIVFNTNNYDNVTFNDQKDLLSGGAVWIQTNNLNFNDIPLPALKEILLNLTYKELNMFCNMSRRIKEKYVINPASDLNILNYILDILMMRLRKMFEDG